MSTEKHGKDPDRSSPKTRTLPDELRGAWFEGPDVVTGLQVVGTPLQFELRRDVRSFRLGSAKDCDIVLPYPYLSRVHCVPERRASGMRVHDHDSRNGLVFKNREERAFDLRPGETFFASTVALLALNDEMRSAFPVLSDLVGAEDEPRMSNTATRSPSDLVQLATLGHHLLITGQPGCDQDRLARTLHTISLLRRRPLVEIDRVPDHDRVRQREILDAASRSTLMITIDPKSPMFDGTFVSMIFSPSYQIRVIALAPYEAKAREVLGGEYVKMEHVALRPLSERAGAIPRLLDARLAERDSALRVSDLSARNQAALQAFGWPNNFIDLRLAAERLIVIAREPSLRKAAEALGVSSSSLHRWFTQLGLELPLLAEASGHETSRKST